MHEHPVEIHDLTVSYSEKPVLWNIDVVVPEGVMVGIIGPNGAGKSTLLKAVMGLLRLSSGWVKIYGKSIDEQRGLVGYVPQREEVDWDFPITVRDLVLMGRYGHLGLFRRPKRLDHEAVDRALEKVGMSAYANRQIGSLSGGQQQRIFLARALTQESRVYLMDEPFAGVDATTEKAIVGLLMEMRKEKRTMLVVSHDLHSAPDYFDYLLLVNRRLVAFGPTEEVFTEDLLRKTYGGHLTVLSRAAEAIVETRGRGP
ncbi:MAG: metal ABC transporter ATP-binding protein [Planctomycetota bacterium]|nr:metal ABC transporter ATP-binding protein [Planctomycetota bacterium]